jgi:pre-mRNA-splicing factor SYF2
MSPKEYVDPESEPQTPEEDEEVSEGDAAKIEDQEKNGDYEGTEAKPMTMEERKAKMLELRAKLVRCVLSLSHSGPLTYKLQRSSALANRASVIEESSRNKTAARDLARLEKQRKLAETLRIRADAEERGEDVERQKNWEWTIEENEEWEKKLARKARRADFEFHGTYGSRCPDPTGLYAFHAHDFPDDAHAARRKYKKEVDSLKPDLEAYNRQKETAMGLAPGTLSQNGSSSTFSLTTFNPTEASSSQVIHLTFPVPLTNSESVIVDGPNFSPATGGSREPLPGCE